MPSKLRWGLLISIPGYHVVGYPEVILEKPLGLPPDREMEFYIDLVLEARLVSIDLIAWYLQNWPSWTPSEIRSDT